MNILVTYDINTETKAGRRRLHKVAQTCKDFGQRVQFSVFECLVSDAQYEDLRAKLKKTINPSKDSVRIYKLRGDREKVVETIGLDGYTDFTDTLIV